MYHLVMNSKGKKEQGNVLGGWKKWLKIIKSVANEAAVRSWHLPKEQNKAGEWTMGSR